MINQKCPSSLLLTADGKFRFFGYAARDYYHNLEPHRVKQYMYFEKFKMSIQNMVNNFSHTATFCIFYFVNR